VTTYGVGALFPAADESFMVVGLDDWSENHATEVPEPRLARSLGVRTFRLPPTGSTVGHDVPVIRFPRMHHCPGCGRLDRLDRFGSWNDHVCHDCQRNLVPSRFVACCLKGHIEDFPYFNWVHRGQEVPETNDHRLRLTTRGQSSSLADLIVSCSCGVAPRSLAGSFGSLALKGVTKCWGRRPWLRESTSSECDETPRTLQRGSSNVWFAVPRAAISIPPWSERAHRVINAHWNVLQHIPAGALLATLNSMGFPSKYGIDTDELVRSILEMRGETDAPPPSEADLRAQEYEALVLGCPGTDPHQQFICEPVTGLIAAAEEVLEGVSRVARLREVRALQGFSRVMPVDAGTDPSRIAPLSREAKDWLPAIEVLGEGVFLRVRDDLLRAWEITDFAQARSAAISAALAARAAADGSAAASGVAPRMVLLHSLAHVLVFASGNQSGFLIYTASGDSAGSLGGLAAQSDPERIWGIVLSAIQRASWCSSDPVCIESAGSGADSLNLSACHACLLLPETSCESANRFLYRATLIGTPTNPIAGFFSSMMVL
jgi:hypothetical protein